MTGKEQTIFDLDRTQEHPHVPEFVLRQHVEQDLQDPTDESQTIFAVAVHAATKEEAKS